MKLHVLSDLHLDMHSYRFETPAEAEVAVVAGDVREGLDKALPLLASEFRPRGVEVVFVPGNHEFYCNRAFGHTSAIDNDISRGRALAAELGVHLLAEGERVVIAGVRFVGATLWTDYEAAGMRERSMATADDRTIGMNDHRKIRVASLGYRRFRPVEALAAHRRQKAAIDAILEAPFAGPTVVVTHHAPHLASLKHGEVRSAIDASYVSDLTELIASRRPDLWIHGHIHQRRDYRIDATRILANPRGYFDLVRDEAGPRYEAKNPAFDPRLVVEI